MATNAHRPGIRKGTAISSSRESPRHSQGTLRVILIGGTSHVGKSTLGSHLAEDWGWEYRSTDKLARHPGRPWTIDGVPISQHVSDHYSTLTVDALMADVLRHYRENVLPQVESLVRARIRDSSGRGLLLEGSALWPPFIRPLLSERVVAVWLTARDETLRRRICLESRYAQRSPRERILIDKFIERTLAFNLGVERTIKDQRLLAVRVRGDETAEALARKCLRKMSGAE